MHSQFVPPGEQIDLTNCDREPIHTPGSIQPHGALMAVDAATERILAASANITAFIGVPLDRVVNALAADVIGNPGADALRSLSAARDTARAPLAIPLARRDIAASVQRVGNTVYVELEPRSPHDRSARERDARRGAQLQRCPGPRSAVCPRCRRTARHHRLRPRDDLSLRSRRPRPRHRRSARSQAGGVPRPALSGQRHPTASARTVPHDDAAHDRRRQ